MKRETGWVLRMRVHPARLDKGDHILVERYKTLGPLLGRVTCGDRLGNPIVSLFYPTSKRWSKPMRIPGEKILGIAAAAETKAS